MAVPLCMKRMARERENLDKPNDDFFVFFEDDNLRSFHAYVIGPKGTLYEHKYVKLKFDIPDRYPLVPPQCKFIQHGGGRIHPNLYVEGKVCLSILGTWAGEPWALAMTIETVLITIRSLLDNQPYKHEPNQPDHPQFNEYVQYGTWTWLLLDYLKYERNQIARLFLEKHVSKNRLAIIEELEKQQASNKDVRQFHSPYARMNGNIANYPKLMHDLVAAVDKCYLAQAERDAQATQTSLDNQSYTPVMQQEQVERTGVCEIIDLEDNKSGAKRLDATHSNVANTRHDNKSTQKKQQEAEIIDLT